MNKKSTLLAAALMAVSSFTVSAEDIDLGSPVESKYWTAGNYYYLKSNLQKENKDLYLSLCGTKADSVIFKTIATDDPKASRDSALWEITKVGTETGGSPIYQFKNKKTKSILSFEKSEDAKPVLAEGISQWSFNDGKISAHWDNDAMILSKGDNGIIFNSEEEEQQSVFEVVSPGEYVMSAQDLGDNFSVFQLSFGGEFEGDIFSGKDLIATKSTDQCVKLKIKGDEFFPDGKDKFLGVDTTKTVISDATSVYGAKFIADSTYTEEYHSVSNDNYQRFKFRADLKNDSLIMLVVSAPRVNDEELSSSDKYVRVVYAQVGDKKVLTVADKRNGDGADRNDPLNGVAPFITVTKGTPAEIAGGTGVYFLKSASKTETAGKYIASYNSATKKIVTMSTTPSVNQPEGQWYIKEEGGMYSIVDRKDNTSLLLKGEVFAVQGMENTFTFGGSADSITVIPQEVDLDNRFLGSANFTKEEIANNGYVLNLIPADVATSNSYAMTADSILQVKTGDAKDAFVFKLEAGEPEPVGGAKDLKDTLFVVKYQLKSQFSDKYVAYDTEKKSLKISNADDAICFQFNTNVDGGKYSMEIVSAANKGKFITADLASSNMVLSETPAYFNFVEMDAPEYATFESGHRQFTSEVQSLTMNPSTFFAEMKSVGQGIDILKSAYEKDNFSLWTMKSDASTADRPLYFITTAVKVSDIPEAASVRHYMVSGRDSSLVYAGNPRVNFIANDTIETMKDSAKNPALWAFKVTENGNYLLENQQEVNNGNEEKFIGIVNSFAVMSKTGAEFSIESVAGPVANESITDASAVKLIGGVGELTILNAGGKRISISNILGQTINSFVASSDNVNIGASRGVLIVSIEGEKAQKVIVK